MRIPPFLSFLQALPDKRFAICLLNNPFGNPECLETAVLFNSCFGVGGAGAVVQQQVSVYVHIFYGYSPPEGWRFSVRAEASAVTLTPWCPC